MLVNKTPYKESWLELLDTLKEEGIITEIEYNNYRDRSQVPSTQIQEDLFFIIHAIWTLYKKLKK